MKKISILVKNEYDANRFAAKVMLVTISFVLLTFMLDVLQIFIVPMATMGPAMSVAAVLLLIPAILTLVLKIEGWYIKYITVTAAVLMVAVISLLLSYHAILLFIYPLAIASLYFSRRLSWFAALLTVSVTTAASLAGFGLDGVVDKNFVSTSELLIYGIIPRDIELLAVSVIFIFLSKRTKAMLHNVLGAEEQKNLLDRMMSITEEARSASGTLAASIEQLSGITDSTAKANEQVADKTSRIADGSENTLKLVDEAAATTGNISKVFNIIADEGQKIADLSMNVCRLTKDNGEILADAVGKMEEIDKVTDQNRDMIMKLGERSNEIGKIVEIISGIASQTNMLALNAAIESARAGEQGRGFAVVAGEVRSLAEQSQQAAKDISTLVLEIIAETEEAMKAMDKSSHIVEEGLSVIRAAGSTFEKVSVAGTRMDEMVQEVSRSTAAAAKDSDRLVEIVNNITEINRSNIDELQGIAAATEQQLAAMQQVTSSVHDIEKISENLLQKVNV